MTFWKAHIDKAAVCFKESYAMFKCINIFYNFIVGDCVN